MHPRDLGGITFQGFLAENMAAPGLDTQWRMVLWQLVLRYDNHVGVRLFKNLILFSAL